MRIPSVRLLCLVAVLPMLAACGFTPLYARHNGESAADDLQTVKIANIGDRDGQVLRNNLIDRFYQHGAPAEPRYVLTISPIEERATEVDILPTSDATREELRFLTYMTLADAKTGDVLLQRDLLEATSYNILSSEFTNLVSQENVRTNALDSLADQIQTQLALYFARQKHEEKH